MIDEFGIRIDNDGIDHINVYSKGKTELGRWLSNFTYSPFEHPDHGWFASVEGYWYWLKTGMRYESLRTLHGFAAKKQGRKYPTVRQDDFEKFIEKALYAKVIQHPDKIPLIGSSNLPFMHYYVYNDVIHHVDGGVWIMEILEDIRDLIKQ